MTHDPDHPRTIRVLVVARDPAAAPPVCERLARLGFTVAGDGEPPAAAGADVARLRPDVVVLVDEDSSPIAGLAFDVPVVRLHESGAAAGTAAGDRELALVVEIARHRATHGSIVDVVESSAARRLPPADEPGPGEALVDAALAAGVAHDLNNVFAIVVGGIEVALDPGIAADGTADILHEIGDAGTRGAALARQLLALRRTYGPAATPTDVAVVVRDVAPMVPRIAGRHVAVAIEPGPAGRYVDVPATQLDAILLGLALRARNAMPDGGRLSVSVERRHDGDDGGPLVSVTFTDSGAGLDLVGSSEGSRWIKDGLARVRHLTERAGGSLHVERTAAGTSATVRFREVRLRG